MRFAGVAYPVDERQGDRNMPLLSVSQYRGVTLRSELTSDESRAENLSHYKVARRGQLVINRMSAYQGALGVAPMDGVVSPDYMVLQIRAGQYGRFWEYLMRSHSFVGEMAARVRGIGSPDATSVRTPRISYADLKLIDVPDIRLPQQRAIADFLDRETAKIDALIEKQNELITLLQERRGAQGWRVGLGQAADRADEDEWFGDPPANWTVDKLGRHTTIVNGSTPSRDNMAYWEGGDFPWLNSSKANLDVVIEADQFVTAVAMAKCHLPVIEPGAVLIGITGQGKTRGSVAQAGLRGTINQHLAAITPDSRFWHPRYLTHLLRAAYTELRFISDEAGSTKGALTCATLEAFRVPRPPLEEQHEIADRLDRETAKIDALIDKATQHVALAQERRAALITAAVAGQIDVTGKAA